MTADSMVPVLSEAEMQERVVRLGGYEPCRERAEDGVVDWRWSRGLSGWDDPEPLACERDGWKRGRLRRERRAGRFLDQDLVGLDADRRPLYVRAHDGAGHIQRETFLNWTAAEVQAATFQMPPYMVDQEPGLIVLKALLLCDGVPVGLQLFHPSQGSLGCSEVYDYDEAGRLVGVDLQIRYPAGEWGADRLDRLLPLYDESGALLAAVIALIYDELQVLAGVSVLGTAGLQAHTASNFDGLLLQPANWIDSHELDLRLEERPELAAALEALDLELLAKPGFGRSLLNEVAAEVTAGQWPQGAHPDRFAFAADVEGEYGEANARKTLGRTRYRQLEAARWF